MTLHIPIRLLAVFVCWLCWFTPELLLACPTCKGSLHEDGTAAAYAISILFMMGMPFVIFSCWVTIIIRLRQGIESVEIAASED